MAEKKDSAYLVGYAKPPQHTRFKPGQSGNPKGRPRTSTTFADDIESELRSSITVVEGGKPRRMTKRRAIAKQQVNSALKGDIRSTKLLLNVREQQPIDQHDNLGALLEEFREKNRRLSAERATEDDISIDPASSRSSTHTPSDEP